MINEVWWIDWSIAMTRMICSWSLTIGFVLLQNCSIKEVMLRLPWIMTRLFFSHFHLSNNTSQNHTDPYHDFVTSHPLNNTAAQFKQTHINEKNILPCIYCPLWVDYPPIEESPTIMFRQHYIAIELWRRRIQSNEVPFCLSNSHVWK